jgi:mono/diheme cytochrome c family protein
MSTPEDTRSNLPETRDELSEAQEFSVQQMHAPVIREHNEPRDGLEPIPVWMGMAFGGLLFWGGMYMSSNAGDFRGDVYDRPAPKPQAFKPDIIPTDEAGLKKLGERIFTNCLACHQQSGEGVPAQFPPLNKSEWVDGEKASTARLARILLYGLSGEINVRGGKFNGAMPGWGGQLKDHQIAAVLTYVRGNWSNKAGPVFPRDITAARAAVGARGTAMTAAELEKVLIDYVDPGATPPDVKK